MIGRSQEREATHNKRRPDLLAVLGQPYNPQEHIFPSYARYLDSVDGTVRDIYRALTMAYAQGMLVDERDVARWRREWWHGYEGRLQFTNTNLRTRYDNGRLVLQAGAAFYVNREKGDIILVFHPQVGADGILVDSAVPKEGTMAINCLRTDWWELDIGLTGTPEVNPGPEIVGPMIRDFLKKGIPHEVSSTGLGVWPLF